MQNPKHSHETVGGEGLSAGTMKDPVCGMSVDPSTAKAKSDYKGMTYYFSSKGCKTKFDSDSAKYDEPAAEVQVDAEVNQMRNRISSNL